MNKSQLAQNSDFDQPPNITKLKGTGEKYLISLCASVESTPRDFFKKITYGIDLVCSTGKSRSVTDWRKQIKKLLVEKVTFGPHAVASLSHRKVTPVVEKYCSKNPLRFLNQLSLFREAASCLTLG